MKKLKCMAALVALILALLAPLGALSEAAGSSPEGFEVVESFEFELLNADVTMYEHSKTGALVMHIANGDTNRVFQITFRTPTLDNTGVPHVFEHATLAGSDKYPSTQLFFNLAYQTYNTYMNASTYSIMTTYPTASLSEKQLLRYADFYVDSVFHPIVLRDESIFRTEAWRYEMPSADAELTLAGTVYSEMRGAYTITLAAAFNNFKTAFPGSTVGNSHGGDPDDIPSMRYEQLTQYHSAYYHPSNSLTVIYGDFENVGDFLALLNAEFDNYEKREFEIKDEGYTPITSPVWQTHDFAVEQGGGTKDGAIVYYTLICDGVEAEDINKLDMLAMLISNDSSLVMERLKDALPAANARCDLEISGPEMAFVFSANGVNEGEEALFKDTIDKALSDIAQSGFTPEETDAVESAVRMDVMLSAEDSSVGVNTIPSILYYWAALDDYKGFMSYVDSLSNFDEYNNDGTFTSLINKYLVNNERCAITLTRPVPGLKEQKDAQLAAQLAEIKAGMTPDEIEAIVQNTVAPAQSTGDASAMVASLQAVTVDSLPEDLRIFEILDELSEGGVRRVDALADITGVGTGYVLFDASALTFEQLCYLKLFTDLLGELDTQEHTSAQLSALITRYMYDGVIRMAVYEEPDGGYTPRVRATWTTLDEDIESTYALVDELLFSTKLNDAERVLGVVSSVKAALNMTINQDIPNLLLYRAMGTSKPSTAIYAALTYIEYYQFLCDTELKLAENPESVLAELEAVRASLNNSYGMVAGSVGDEESIRLNAEAFGAFIADMPCQETQRVDNAPPPAAMSEGIVLNSAVNYNIVYAPYEALGLESSTGDLDALTAMVADAFLYPVLRDQYGAYGVYHGATEDGVYIMSFRDPNIKETYEAYANVAGQLAASEIDQPTLDGYILSSYAYYAMPKGELSGAFSAVLNHLSGISQQETLEDMRELKRFTVEDMRAYADMYAKLVEHGARMTVGSASAIAANADRFVSVLNPLGAVDPTQVALDDVPETHPNYGEIRFVYENGFMAASGDTRFGADDESTLGDIALAMYVYLGGMGAPDEAIAYLAGYEILPAESADTPLTYDDALLYTYYFAWALGMDVESGCLESLDGYAGTDEFAYQDSAAAFMWAIGNGLYNPEETSLSPASAITRAALAGLIANFLTM